MAKGKDKKDKAGKLPKRIGGVKVPKELRKSGAKMVDALSHPLLADVAAAALLAAAAALRDDETLRATAAKARDDAGKSLRALSGEAGAFASLVASAAEAGMRQLKALDTASPSPRPKAGKRK